MAIIGVTINTPSPSYYNYQYLQDIPNPHLTLIFTLHYYHSPTSSPHPSSPSTTEFLPSSFTILLITIFTILPTRLARRFTKRYASKTFHKRIGANESTKSIQNTTLLFSRGEEGGRWMRGVVFYKQISPSFPSPPSSRRALPPPPSPLPLPKFFCLRPCIYDGPAALNNMDLHKLQF